MHSVDWFRVALYVAIFLGLVAFWLLVGAAVSIVLHGVRG